MASDILLLFDAKVMQPGCVILAAAAGTDREVVARFNNWLTAPTPDMRIYRTTPEQLDRLVEISNAR